MKILNILCYLFLSINTLARPITWNIPLVGKFLKGLVRPCNSLAHSSCNFLKSCLSGTSKLKTASIIAIAVPTLCCLYKLKRYFWGKKRIAIPPVTPPAQQAGPTAAAAEPLPEQVFQAATNERLAIVPYFNDLSHHVLAPLHFTKPDGTNITIQQLKVLSQFAPDGGGGASCGYHAGPKNIPAITGLIQGLETEHLLTNPQIALRMFNPSSETLGTLRQEINNNRIKTALKWYYGEFIKVRVPEEPVWADLESTRVMGTLYKQLCNECLENLISET